MSTPTPITALARRWRLEVNMGTSEAPDWQLNPAVTAFNWNVEPNNEDDGTYDDGGWGDSTKTAQSWSVTATFNRKKSADDTVFNAVHEKLRIAARAFGAASEVEIRFADRDGLPEAYQGTALVTWEPQNDARTDLDQVQVTFTGKRELAEVANWLAA